MCFKSIITGFKKMYKKLFCIGTSAVGLYGAWYFSFLTPKPDFHMTLSWMAFFLLGFIGFVFEIDEISLFGHKVKMKEIKEKANELQSITKAVVALSLDSLSSMGRFDAYAKIKKKQEIKNKMKKYLKESGYNSKDIKDIFFEFDRWIIFDFQIKIIEFAIAQARSLNENWINENCDKIKDPEESNRPLSQKLRGGDPSKIDKLLIPENKNSEKELLDLRGLLEDIAKLGDVRKLVGEEHVSKKSILSVSDFSKKIKLKSENLSLEVEKYISMLKYYEENGEFEDINEANEFIERN